MRSSKPQPSSRSTDRRYSARYLILIYRDTRPHFDPLEIQRLVAREQGKCTIVRQAESIYLAFVDFAGKRFQTRNLGLFDVQGYHPKWIHVTSSPWRTLDKMMAQGHVLWNGVIPRPQKQPSPARKRGPGKEPASSNPWELVGSATNEESLQELLQKEVESEQSKPSERQLDCVPLAGGETEMARNVQYWQDGYRAGYKAAMSMSHIHQSMPNPPLSTIDPPGAEVSQLFVSNDCADSDSADSTCPSQSAFPGDILGEVSQLDWNLELEDVWNQQVA